jgi:hypothetical protein
MADAGLADQSLTQSRNGVEACQSVPGRNLAAAQSAVRAFSGKIEARLRLENAPFMMTARGLNASSVPTLPTPRGGFLSSFGALESRVRTKR